MTNRDELFTEDIVTKSERYLHTPCDFARRNLLYVQEVGYLKSLKPHRCVRERLDSFLILLVVEGRGSLEISKRHYEVIKGDCAWINCMDHYEHISDDKEAWELAWIHLNGHSAICYYELFMKYNDNQNIFHIDNVDKWLELIQHIMKIQQESNIIFELQSGELLMHLLNKVIDRVTGIEKHVYDQENLLAGKIRDFINEQYAEKNVLQLIVNAFGGTSDSLANIFVNAFGITLEEYISNRRYNAAKELLRFSIKSSDKVAEESGIGDVIKMENMFQSNDNMSSTEYRGKWAGWIR